MAYKDLLDDDVDRATVKRAMKDILTGEVEYIPTPDAILDYISKQFDVEVTVIKGNQRNRDAVAARHIAAYLIRSMTNLSQDEIGKYLGGRDHTTVMYSLRQIESKMKKDPTFAEQIKEMKTNISSRK